MKMILEIVEGRDEGHVFEFDRHDTFVVGRAAGTHLRLPDDRYFSRHHFLLEFNPPRCYLRDLGSRNGTLVNGKRVKEAFLNSGDLISGGRTCLRLQLVEVKPLTATPVLCLACGKTADGGSVGEMAATRVKSAPVEAVNVDSVDELTSTCSYVCESCKSEMLKNPQPIPGYEIIRKLGKGGMGIVYLARHAASGRPTALKLILPESAASERAMAMFLREINILTQLEHGRIVRFFELGMAQGQFFFAMEYVDAIDMQLTLASYPQTSRVKLACGIMCQVLEALTFAHEKSFIHRDIKPSNILLTRVNGKLAVKVADFGLAKNFENAGFSGMTRTGEVRGSIPFMPPEQVLNCRNATPLTDIYAAGATLYCLLSRKYVHNFDCGKDPYRVILEDEIVPLTRHCADLPSGLVDVVHQALEKDASQRFDTATDMRNALLPYARVTGR